MDLLEHFGSEVCLKSPPMEEIWFAMHLLGTFSMTPTLGTHTNSKLYSLPYDNLFEMFLYSQYVHVSNSLTSI